MDTTLQRTSLNRLSVKIDRSAAARRAYLDTYAKRTRQKAVVSGALAEVDLQTVSNQISSAIEAPVAVPKVETQPETIIATAPESIVEYKTKATAQPQQYTHKTYLDNMILQSKKASNYITNVGQMDVAKNHKPEQISTRKTFNKETIEERLNANLRALYQNDSLASQLENNANSASASHIRTIVASALTCGILAVGIFAFLGRVDSAPVVAQPVDAPVIAVQVSNNQRPTGRPAAAAVAGTPGRVDPQQPVRLIISSIGVNAPIMSLGTTPEGLIAVPASYGVVGWYNKAAVPGQAGPSVLVGHYTGGYGGVFDKLKDIKNGALITSTNAKGESVTFKVTAKREYERSKVPMADLFKSSDQSRLEIITCSGTWQSNNYNKRLVVTAELVR